MGGGKWKEHLIDDSWSQPHALTLVDLDKDGQIDIVTGKRYLAHEADPGAFEPLGLYWYRWSPKEGHFIKHVIDYGSKAGGGIQIIAVDIDGDGDIDLVAPGKSGLFLFEQVDFSQAEKTIALDLNCLGTIAIRSMARLPGMRSYRSQLDQEDGLHDFRPAASEALEDFLSCIQSSRCD